MSEIPGLPLLHQLSRNSNNNVVADVTGRPRSFSHPSFGMALGFQERQELVNSFMGVYNKRAELIRSLNSLRNMDVVQTIIDVIIDDAFTASQQNYVFSIEYTVRT